MKFLETFFEKRTRTSSKPFKMIRALLIGVMVAAALLAFHFGFNFFIKAVIMLGGFAFLAEGIEGCFTRDARRRILTDFGISALLFLNFFME